MSRIEKCKLELNTAKERKAWFEGLAVGDLVYLEHAFGKHKPSVSIVREKSLSAVSLGILRYCHFKSLAWVNSISTVVFNMDDQGFGTVRLGFSGNHTAVALCPLTEEAKADILATEELVTLGEQRFELARSMYSKVLGLVGAYTLETLGSDEVLARCNRFIEVLEASYSAEELGLSETKEEQTDEG